MDGELSQIIADTTDGYYNERIGVSEDDEDSFSTEDSSVSEEPSENVLRTYVVVVNDDGSLVVDKTGLIDPDASDPQCVIPVTLPVNKLRNPNNPFPGAKIMSNSVGRTRKTKPQPMLYGNADGSFAYQDSSNAQLGPTAQMEIDQLDPQDMAMLESVLQSAQAGDLLGTLNFNNDVTSNSVPGGGAHLWDHSYSALSAAPIQQQMTVSEATLSQASANVLKRMGESLDEGSPSPTLGRSAGRQGPNMQGRRTNVVSSAQSPAMHHTPSSSSNSPSARRVSEGDSGNIRRSQRHQDRIERQEAERIKAENQQMLQREKEMMLEGHQTVVKPMDASPVPTSVDTPPPADTQLLLSSASSSATSSSDKRPARQRKRPAHLSDANYVQLDEDGRPIELMQAMSPSIEDMAGTFNDDGSPSLAISADIKEESMDAGDLVEEDDPNRLWCLCKQPHNNRFMICCDQCDDWFHGKCVNVTKVQAKLWEAENKKWYCPPCKKALNIETTGTSSQTPRRRGRPVGSGRRSSGTPNRDPQSPEVIKLEKKELVRSHSVIDHPKKQEVDPNAARRKSSSGIPETSDFATGRVGCVQCSNPAKEGSVYCSNECVSEFAAAAAKNKEDASAVPVTPSSAEIDVQPVTSVQGSSEKKEDSKKKRFLSTKSDQQKKTPDIFAFHVIQSGATKSTEMVPARPKEAHTTNSTSNQSKNVSNNASEKSSNSSTPSKSAPSPGISAKQFYGAEVSSKTPPIKTAKEETGKVSSVEINKSDVKAKAKTPSKHPTGDNASAEKRKSKEHQREIEKEKDAIHGRDTEKRTRDNIRKNLREAFTARHSQLDDTDKATIPEANTPQKIAEDIEEEIYSAFPVNSGSKYLNKYRSIIFNIKDQKNFLFREILQGNVTPKQLVKMDPTEMASSELAEWRQKEQEKNLEMIKRAELEKLAEAKKQELLDKGADVEVVEQKKQLDIADVLEFKDVPVDSSSHDSVEKTRDEKSSHRKLSSSKHSGGTTKDKHSDRKSHSSHEKGKHESRDRKSRHRSKDRRSKNEAKGKDSSDKSKEKHDRKSERRKSDHDRSRSRHVSERVNDLGKESPKNGKSNESAEYKKERKEESPVVPPQEDVVIKSGTALGKIMDVEQELPSSTIKTPDFADEKKDGMSMPLLKTTLMMHELGQFNASVYNVSHNSLDGIFFPESPVPIVGRIAPETVWDYIDKMKKTKEVIVLRLQPEQESDFAGYMAFFTYLSSRGRLGVMGGHSAPLKDCYLIPLDKHQPVNRALLPFHGPGLPNDRNHCLLALITRHGDGSSTGTQIKRKLSSESATAVLKKKKLGDTSKASTRRSMIASTDDLEAEVLKASEQPAPDDDQPYTPWGEEEESAEKKLEELDREIAKEKEQIANIAFNLNRTEHIAIPGLDGDFPLEPALPQLREATVKELVLPSSSHTDSVVPVKVALETLFPGGLASLSGQIGTSIDSAIVVPDSPASETNSKTVGISDHEAVQSKSEPPVFDLDEEAYSPTDYSEDCAVVAVKPAGASEPSSQDTPPKEDASASEVIPGLGISDSDIVPLFAAPTVQKILPETAAADVDEEPPPPGDVDATVPAAKPAKIALDSVFSLPSSSVGKPKIQINLKKKLELSLPADAFEASPSTTQSLREPSMSTAFTTNLKEPSKARNPAESETKAEDTPSQVPFTPFTGLDISPKVSVPTPPVPTAYPPVAPVLPTLPNISVPPPGIMPFPLPTPQIQPPGLQPPVGGPPRPMIPVPPKIGGIGINVCIPPPPMPGMVPPLPMPPRGVNLNLPRFPPGGMALGTSTQPVSPSRPRQNRFVPPYGERGVNTPQGGSTRTSTPASASAKTHGNFSKGPDRFRSGRFSRFRSRSRSPERNRSRSPRKNRSRSPGSIRSRSPHRNRSGSPIKNKSRSPASRSRSRGRNRSRSPLRNRSRSSGRSRSRSRDRRRRRRISKSKSRSPQNRRRSRSRSKSPMGRRRYSRSRSPLRSARRRKSRSPSPNVSTPVVKK